MENDNKNFEILNKKYKTRDGNNAVVLLKTPDRLIGVYVAGDKAFPMGWQPDGFFIGKHNPVSADLVDWTPEELEIA
jgi:hypothetical protein